MVNVALTASTVKSVGEEKRLTRDERYKQILVRQLGANGVNLLVAYSFIIVVLLLLVILSTVGYAGTFNSGKISGPGRLVLTSATTT